MGQLVIEQAGTIVSYQAVAVGLVGRRDAQRGLEILAREGESMGTIMRGADDHE